MKYKYLVALSESTLAEDLEALLNEKATDGWELFMLHEVDSRMGKIQYNCIFSKVEDDSDSEDGETVEIKDITDFKSQIEQMYKAKDSYNDYLELLKKISATKKEINETKISLESVNNEKERSILNTEIQEEINRLDNLKEQLSKVSDSSQLYDRINSSKIIIYLSDELLELAEKDNEDNLIVRNIKLRQDITDKLGCVIPNIKYCDGIELESYQYRIDIRGVPAATGFVYPSFRMFYKGQANINRKPKDAVVSIDPVYLSDVYWINEKAAKNFWDSGLSASEVITSHLSYTCLKHFVDLMDYKDINKFIEIVRKENFDLVENLIPDIISVGDLGYTLANLVRELVPIRDITFIFEKIMDLYNYAVEKELLLEKLRVTLKRQISYSRIDENTNINAITIDPQLDKYLKDNLITPEHSNQFIDLSKDEMELLITNTARIIEKAKGRIENTVILCSSAIRQSLFAIYEEFIPGLAVFSHEEVSSEVEMTEIGTLERRHVYRPKKRIQKT